MAVSQPPAHLVAEPTDRRTLCGRDVHKREGWPYLQACHVPMYREAYAGRGEVFEVCSDCWVVADLDEVAP